MMWRYGPFSLLKLNRFVSNLLTSFASIYPRLEAGEAFPGVRQLLEGMGGDMEELTRVTIAHRLEEVGVGRELVGELGTVASRVNYGQFPSTLHGFVGAVGLAGVDGNLWAVEGGNFRVAQCALEKSGASFEKGRVEAINLKPEGGLLGSCAESDCPEAEFDVVVVAAPQTRDKTKIAGLNNNKFPGRYHRCVATVVHGDLKLEAVNSST